MSKLLLPLFLLQAVFICGCNFKFDEEFRPPRYDVYWQNGAAETLVTGDIISVPYTQSVGTPGTLTLILKCTGEAWLTIGSFEVADADFDGFSLGAVTGVGAQLDKNDQATAVVNFSPTTAGNKSCTVVICSNAAEYESRSITVNLTAN